MTLFALNLALMLGWISLTGTVSLANLALGFAVGWIVLWIIRPLFGDAGYFERVPRATGLTGFFLWELVRSSLRVAGDVLAFRPRNRPGIVGVPLEPMSDAEITMLASLVTLTPGTLTIDVSEDRRTLWVHTMFLDDAEALRHEVKDGMERRVLRVTR